MLKFESALRYSSPGSIPSSILEDFSAIISKIARGRQEMLEHFKTYFAAASGTTSNLSSSASWAATDLDHYMAQASDNAPLFIEAFYDACEDFNKSTGSDLAPDFKFINGILAKHGAPYQIDPPNLIINSTPLQVSPPEIPATLDENANNIIQKSLSESHRLLADGKHRQAVQELLWLLETITTVFPGMTAENNVSIEGKYFNKILKALKLNSKGTALKQIIGWITTLHGYLSAPAGGGIRHGIDLKEGVATSAAEAKLYCNLITSYISFLLSEYARLKGKDIARNDEY
jgi:hypothetical protein